LTGDKALCYLPTSSNKNSNTTKGKTTMKNITTQIGKLRIIKRLPSSVLGNPRYLVDINGLTCRTAPDSAHGYNVQKLDGKDVHAAVGTHYGHTTINTLTEIAPIKREVTTRIKYDKEYNEYTVELHDGHVHRVFLDYYTDDKTDAIETADAMLKDYKGA
jgi:hypothetical protein